MGLNKQNGNMYDFVTHTWNTIKGKCYHDCSYCYMKVWGKLPDIRFDTGEFNTPLGQDRFIFVGSSNDMFAKEIPNEWIEKTIEHCKKFNNRYLFQTKNPDRMLFYTFPENTVFGTTIETNRNYEGISLAPPVRERAVSLGRIKDYQTMVTIEPILDFDLEELIDIIRSAKPDWVNIGADSKKGNLPEPSGDKVRELIDALSFMEIKTKKNLRRLKSA